MRYAEAMLAFAESHAVTIHEFGRMVDAGVFGADNRVELIEGHIVDMSPIGSPHQACVDRLTTAFAPLASADLAILRIRGAFVASDISQPQPDLALIRPRDDYYAGAHPGPQDLFLVVEVADSSLRYDRWTKLPLYARAGVAEAWLVDLQHEEIEVATGPSEEGYRRSIRVDRGGTVAPTAFPDLALPVDRILG
jgi:Uma2 family endonuclease